MRTHYAVEHEVDALTARTQLLRSLLQLTAELRQRGHDGRDRAAAAARTCSALPLRTTTLARVRLLNLRHCWNQMPLQAASRTHWQPPLQHDINLSFGADDAERHGTHVQSYLRGSQPNAARCALYDQQLPGFKPPYFSQSVPRCEGGAEEGSAGAECPSAWHAEQLPPVNSDVLRVPEQHVTKRHWRNNVAYPPKRVTPITASPTLTLRTLAPISATTPENSRPGVKAPLGVAE